ncbi:hypothetical protein DLAC_08111 [Tieghemostelium lacteum]|uniref:CBF1-interacting co-repressor CIR N-terminal domain-containing protein n=1 Tax=Tieghemostelium lacteum TaxID=361077 RepID=A0A151ZBD3_TIELA|nr:hypothetical protein DLAC_08111 [Tieghemostelium lacteum]|eukprot:KYQ91194.1 hypothetical protein DLAC_08111 [Tieghemostelium lacteum]
MNILPHKSWNPYSQKNKDKVEKDEKEHQIKLDIENQKQINAQSESRYRQLKNDLKKRKFEDFIEGTDDQNVVKPEQFTIFPQELYGKSSELQSKSSAGYQYNTKLGGTEAEEKGKPKPWDSNSIKDSSKTTSKKKLKTDKWLKHKEDPMILVNKVLGKPNYTNTDLKPVIIQPNSIVKSQKKSIEQLRQERLERELKERKRVEHMTKDLKHK